MPALFALLHHLAALTLVSALAVEFVLIRDEITTQRAQNPDGRRDIRRFGRSVPGGRTSARLLLRERRRILERFISLR